jgi:hypothetical protein
MFKNSKVHYDSKVNKTDSVIYFNANIYNDPLTNPQQAKLARFNQSISSGSVVDLPENYYMAIVRFAISHALIPLYQFKDNFYSITLRRAGVDYQQFLTYQDAGPGYSQYGYDRPVFFYQQFVSMINTALDNANLALPVPQQSPIPSFVTYDADTERFTLFIPSKYSPDDQDVRLYFNSNLYQQIQLLNSRFLGYNQTNGKDYQILNYLIPRTLPAGYVAFNQITLPGTGPAPPPPDVPFLVFTQERKALYLLNEVQSIVFTSTTLNVTKEYTGRNDGSGSVGSIPILADFVPDQSTGRDLSEYQYNVQGPPRLVNLTNTIPITDIDYQVGIRFRDGTIVPLYLEPGETCEVKFGFFKKSLYDNNFEY